MVNNIFDADTEEDVAKIEEAMFEKYWNDKSFVVRMMLRSQKQSIKTAYFGGIRDVVRQTKEFILKQNKQ